MYSLHLPFCKYLERLIIKKKTIRTKEQYVQTELNLIFCVMN